MKSTSQIKKFFADIKSFSTEGFNLPMDRFMSGHFFPLFSLIFGVSFLVFLVIWAIIYGIGYWSGSEIFVREWSMGDAFIQFSNPTRKFEQGVPATEWIPIVIFNLFGLFVLNGLVLTIFVNWVSNRRDRHLKGEARYTTVHSHPHAVIIGAHPIVASLSRELISSKRLDYVIIQTRRDPEKVRREIEAEIPDEVLAKRVIIYSGDRTSRHELEELRLDTASEIFLIGEPSSLDGTSHDSINMQTWEIINSLSIQGREELIPCHVMFEYQSTFSAFQLADLGTENSRVFRFIPFSIYENWAQQVLLCKPKAEKEPPFYLPLDGMDGIGFDSPCRVHLIVAGMSKMGIALAIEAAHVAHYPNFNNPQVGRPRTLITFIDRNAQREMTFFMGRFRQLFHMARWRFVKADDSIVRPADPRAWDIYDTSARISSRPDTLYPWHDPMKDPDCGSPYCGTYLGEDIIDVDFEFIEGDIALPSVQKYLSDASCDPLSRTTVSVCLPVAAESMSAALYFGTPVYENAQQIWVYQTQSGAMVNAVSKGMTGQGHSRFGRMRPFGMIDKCDYLSRINSLLPRMVAYAYTVIGNMTFEAAVKKLSSLDRFTQAINDNWLGMKPGKGKSAIAQQWSNIYCANTFESKSRSVAGRSLEDEATVTDLAQTEHTRWVMEQLLLGIRPVGPEYGPRLPLDEEKDKELRTELKSRGLHPDIISNKLLGSTVRYDQEIARMTQYALDLVKLLQKND